MTLRVTLSLLVAIATLTASLQTAAVETAVANSKSGRDYIEACHGFVSLKPDPTGILQHRCVEIVQSSSDYETALRHECLPASATLRQLMSVVVEYLDRNPEKLDQDLSTLASAALKAKFPCLKGI